MGAVLRGRPFFVAVLGNKIGKSVKNRRYICAFIGQSQAFAASLRGMEVA
jgi:hypothetical protein